MKNMVLSIALQRLWNDSRTWKQTDIQKAITLLEISECEIPLYFFTPEVQKIEL